MSDSTASLRRTIASATDLQAVVRTMKALAASSIGQYERSVLALDDYYRTVEIGLGACFRATTAAEPGTVATDDTGPIAAIVFGSDQGLIGQFNETIADYAIATLAALPERSQAPVRYWAVGERVHDRLADAGMPMLGLFHVPGSVKGIAPLVGRIQVDSEAHRASGSYSRVYVFHNRPAAGAVFEPVGQRLLPLDAAWQRGLAEVCWPTKTRPEVMPDIVGTMQGFVREYLFISLFRACAESLASENASRLAAMTRADRNIEDLLAELQGTFHRVRQNSIDEELFDVTAGFMALSRTAAASYVRRDRGVVSLPHL
jgi:F-type H+-transporting ATPase subunit gamma